MNMLTGYTTTESEDLGQSLSENVERGLTETLASLREVSDALWQTTATLVITTDTILDIDELLRELQERAISVAENSAVDSIGIGYASRLAALLKKASFQDINLLTQETPMDVLVQAKVKNGVRSKVFQTIPPSNLSLDNGPFRISHDAGNNSARIVVLNSHNPSVAFAELESISICLRMEGGPRRTVTCNLKWTRTPKYICAVLNSAIRCTHPDIGDIPVSFDGNSILIEPHENIEIEAICLQGPTVGALGHIKTLLSNETCNAEAIIAAVDLALLACAESLKNYRDKLNDIKNMESMTLATMERIALMTVMPQSSEPESAAIMAVNTAQLISSSNYDIGGSSLDILKLMLTDGPDRH